MPPVLLALPPLVPAINEGASDPSSITAGYLLGEDEWELLGRWERFDDELETDRISFGVVWCSSFVPQARWALLYQELASDFQALEGERFELSFPLANP